jgi:alcohol oxidase
MSTTNGTHVNGTPLEVDIIIAGGGTAGCLIAGRLAKANPSLEILVVESGIDTKDNPQITTPAIYLANIAPGSNTATFYKSKPSEHLAGREAVVPMGGCLGGGSSINFMMYTRAQGVDFESWDTPGWSPKELLPLLKKTETYHVDEPDIDKSVHGYEGEFNVSRGTFTAKAFQDDWINASKSIGLKEVSDTQDLKEGDAVQRWLMWVDPKTGNRQDVPHRLIHPLLEAGNTKLKVLTECLVERVIFDGDKAVGIEYVPNKKQQAVTTLTKNAKTSPITVRARKLVVVSAGSLSSPQVLQRSGIGSKEKLSSLDIPVVSDVPGVGTNYQDHHLVLTPYLSKAKPEDTLDGLLSGRLPFDQALKQKASDPSKSLMGWNGIDVCSKLRPTESEVKALGPDFEELWNKDFQNQKSRPMMLIAAVSAFLGDHSTIPVGQYFTMGTYTAYPYSRGSIHITGKSANDTPDFDSGFLSHPADVKKQLWAYKKQREIARRLSHYNGAMEAGHPKFDETSKASFKVDSTGTDGPIEYSEADDQAIEQFIRENVQTTWHSLGTCAMKPLSEGGTVDKNLNVYGVSGLKVADLSICPENVGANTYSTALLVGEKAAEIIAKELGLKL